MKKIFLICILVFSSLVNAAVDSNLCSNNELQKMREYTSKNLNFVLVQIQVTLDGEDITESDSVRIKVNRELFTPTPRFGGFKTGEIEKGLSEYEVKYQDQTITKQFEFETDMHKKDYPGDDVEFYSNGLTDVIRVIFNFESQK